MGCTTFVPLKNARKRIVFGHKKKRVMGIEPTCPAWKAGVLTIVLHPHIIYLIAVPRTGIEPVTRGFSVLCSTN